MIPGNEAAFVESIIRAGDTVKQDGGEESRVLVRCTGYRYLVHFEKCIWEKLACLRSFLLTALWMGNALMLGDCIDFWILDRGISNFSPDVTHRCSDGSLILGQHSHPLKDARQRSEQSACNCNIAR